MRFAFNKVLRETGITLLLLQSVLVLLIRRQGG
jgi:hypothetical protein